MWLELVTAPTSEPLTLTEARQQVNRFDGDEDVLLTDLIKDVRDYVEAVTNRQLIMATYRLHLDGLGWPIELPRPPVISASVSVAYLDTSGATQTLATTDYLVSLPSGAKAPRAWIQPTYGAVWPATYGQSGAVTVTFQSGYGVDGTSVPRSLRRAMLLLIGHWHRSRSETEVGTIVSAIPMGVTSLLAPYISRETQAA